jgi:hypothetical protein
VKKKKLIAISSILLVIILSIFVGIKSTTNNQLGQIFNNISTKTIVGLSGLILLLLFISYLFFRLDIGAKILSFYRLDLNGKLILRFTANDLTRIKNYQQFKDDLADFQTNYDFLEYNIDYSANSINIDLKTLQKLNIKNGEHFLEQFVTDLDDMLSLLSPEQVFIDLNITGKTNNLTETINFLIVNQNNQIGLNKTKYSTGLWAKFIDLNN